ncbi:14897_t:CDS:2, partial [Funneliformis geosporum]
LINLELEFIHKQEIIHRDFHSGNILIENESDIVISDLGISKLSTDLSDDENNYYGIMPYIAPEIFQEKKYTKASDIYSFSIIMWELMNGKRPFEDQAYDTDLMIRIIDAEGFWNRLTLLLIYNLSNLQELSLSSHENNVLEVLQELILSQF